MVARATAWQETNQRLTPRPAEDLKASFQDFSRTKAFLCTFGITTALALALASQKQLAKLHLGQESRTLAVSCRNALKEFVEASQDQSFVSRQATDCPWLSFMGRETRQHLELQHCENRAKRSTEAFLPGLHCPGHSEPVNVSPLQQKSSS